MLITVEGGEGAGKSTLITSLGGYFRVFGKKTLLTREPGGTQLGEKIRELLLFSASSVDSRSELFLFLADRAQHVSQVIRPALQRGIVVICDRFYDSTTVYQGIGRELGMETAEEMSLYATGGLTPDITFYLDLDPKQGLSRCKTRDRIEKEDIHFHRAIRTGFLHLAKKHKRFILIDASQSPKEVFEDAKNALEKYL